MRSSPIYMGTLAAGPAFSRTAKPTSPPPAQRPLQDAPCWQTSTRPQQQAHPAHQTPSETARVAADEEWQLGRHDRVKVAWPTGQAGSAGGHGHMRVAWFGTWDSHRNPIAPAVKARDPGVMARGTVKFFKPDRGIGLSPLPIFRTAWTGGVHFSAIEMDGYQSLQAGDQVEFGYQAAQQDSFRFVATWVRKL